MDIIEELKSMGEIERYLQTLEEGLLNPELLNYDKKDNLMYKDTIIGYLYLINDIRDDLEVGKFYPGDLPKGYTFEFDGTVLKIVKEE